MGRAFGGGDPSEPLALARLACAVGEDAPHADVCAAVLELLDLFREHLAPPPPGRPFPLAGRFIIAAMAVARTPDVPLPPNLHAPPPTREEADAGYTLAAPFEPTAHHPAPHRSSLPAAVSASMLVPRSRRSTLMPWRRSNATCASLLPDRCAIFLVAAYLDVSQALAVVARDVHALPAVLVAAAVVPAGAWRPRTRWPRRSILPAS